ncbi:MAG: NAD+ synthase [Bdellovibrionales bacterium]|nr:NAD+ synthase [Bdellovibrionales bacterium]
MRIALAQINSVLGDFFGNRKKILDYCQRAADKNCDLIVFPEASLFGYLPMDLLERPSVIDSQKRQLHFLSKEIPKGLAVLLGAFTDNMNSSGKPYCNSAVLLSKDKLPRFFPKKLLPAYDVFDEGRHIEPGPPKGINFFSLKGKNILVTVCEDLWAWPEISPSGRSPYAINPLTSVKKKMDLVVNLSASPFTSQKGHFRRKVVAKAASCFKAPVIYVNMVGAQDELIFDGGSFAVDKSGNMLTQAPFFEENLQVIDLDEPKNHAPKKFPSFKKRHSKIELLRQALVLGMRDFAQKVGIGRLHLGLSGGIDSALVACLAKDAVGPQNVCGISIPGPYSRPESLTSAEQLAQNIGIEFKIIPMNPIYSSVISGIEDSWGAREFGLMNENVQARLRGLLLMGYSNRENSLLLNTSNKSELAVGYSTLYGDLCGGLSPIGDLLKGEVIAMCKHYNLESELIPHEIITRPPSAELRPNQLDQDTLPPYELLDQIVHKLVVKRKAPRGPLEKRILSLMVASEFKRWQAPPILKVSDHAFGRGRRFPIAQHSLD